MADRVTVDYNPLYHVTIIFVCIYPPHGNVSRHLHTWVGNGGGEEIPMTVLMIISSTKSGSHDKAEFFL